MPIVLNGSGTVTGISAGGLPDGCITAAELATGVGGKILQVKQATKTDTASLSTQTFTEITDLTQTITTVAGSKVYAVGSFYMGAPSAYNAFVRLVRVDANGSTNYPYIGDASGSALRATAGGLCQSYNYGEINSSFIFLDTPSGAGTHTYKVEWRSGYSGTTVYLGRTAYAIYAESGIIPSSFTLMEVAA
jgi:hypothetical protein